MISPLLEKFFAKVPSTLQGPVREHLKALKELLEGELEAARKSEDQKTRLAVAGKIITICSAICTTVAIEPIPLADFPILTSVQIGMIGAIMRVSGRNVSRQAITEFLGALGMNIGAGLALREGARAVAKLLPGFGNAISGAIAGGATYALGRAASAYFIEGASITDVRTLFKRVGRKPAATGTRPLALPPK